MTRVNCIPVEYLSREHLIAENSEITRLAKLSPDKHRNNIPSSYTLGKGHMIFFLDKGKYLIERHKRIKNEMLNRGYTSNARIINLDHWPKWAMNNWKPNYNEQMINWHRISTRLKLKSLTEVSKDMSNIMLSTFISLLKYGDISIGDTCYYATPTHYDPNTNPFMDETPKWATNVLWKS